MIGEMKALPFGYAICSRHGRSQEMVMISSEIRKDTIQPDDIALIRGSFPRVAAPHWHPKGDITVSQSS